MDIALELTGFVNYENHKWPFRFTKDKFTLSIYPDYDSWLKYNDPIFVLDHFFPNKNYKNPEERKYCDINGFCSSNYYVSFHVVDSPNYQNGVVIFPVVWLYYTKASIEKNNIKTIKITGETIDDYFSPRSVFKHTIVSGENNSNKIESIKVDARSSDIQHCGSFKYLGSEVFIEIQAYASINSGLSTPLSSQSACYLKVNNPVGVYEAEALCLAFLRTLQVLYYRKNVCLNDFEIFAVNDLGTISDSGVIALHLKNYPEETAREKKCGISNQYIGDKLGNLIQKVISNEVGISFLCDSMKDTYSYDPARIYMILADFERFFNKKYKETIKDSDSFLATKENVIEYLNARIDDTKSNELRNDLTRIKKAISNIGKGMSYENKVKMALDDMKPIMAPFISFYYEGEYSRNIRNLSKRIGTIRNKIAHGSLNVVIKQENLKDIKIVEHLIYGLLLKSVLLSDVDIKKALKHLFDEEAVA